MTIIEKIKLITLASIFFTFLSLYLNPKPDEKKPQQSLDTYIPPGYVLVPIEVENYETLDSVLGSYGVVDLYPGTNGPEKTPQKPLIKGIRMLRSPHPPHQYAVLAPETLAPEIIRAAPSFRVVVQNPNSSGTEIVTKKSVIKNRKIILEM